MRNRYRALTIVVSTLTIIVPDLQLSTRWLGDVLWWEIQLTGLVDTVWWLYNHLGVLAMASLMCFWGMVHVWLGDRAQADRRAVSIRLRIPFRKALPWLARLTGSC